MIINSDNNYDNDNDNGNDNDNDNILIVIAAERNVAGTPMVKNFDPILFGFATTSTDCSFRGGHFV